MSAKKKTVDEIRQEIAALGSAGSYLSGVVEHLHAAGTLAGQATTAVHGRRRDRALQTVAELEQALADARAYAHAARTMLDEKAVCPSCQVTALVTEIVAALADSDESGHYAALLPEFIDRVRARAADTGADLYWLPDNEHDFRELLYHAADAAYEDHDIAVTYHLAIDMVDFHQLDTDAELDLRPVAAAAADQVGNAAKTG